jgi:hypothetical protein
VNALSSKGVGLPVVIGPTVSRIQGLELLELEVFDTTLPISGPIDTVIVDDNQDAVGCLSDVHLENVYTHFGRMVECVQRVLRPESGPPAMSYHDWIRIEVRVIGHGVNRREQINRCHQKDDDEKSDDQDFECLH